MRSILVLLSLVLCTDGARAQLAGHFPVIGNERHVVTDRVSGREVIFLTDGKYINSTQYPHNRGWLENDRYVMFESTRPRPAGKPATGDNSDYRHVERQLLAADVETGDIYWLATIEVEDTARYGRHHLAMSTQYHADYAPATHSVVYYDMTGHNLYMLSLTTGERRHVLHVPDGTIGDPPTICDDGTRVMIYIAYPDPARSPLFGGRTTIAAYLDINPATNEAVGPLHPVYSWTHRRYPIAGNPDNDINICHAVINPANKDEFSFCHGYNGYSDGSIDCVRTWYGRTDGSVIRMANPTPKGHIFTHEIWGPKGRLIYYVDIVNSGGISAVDPRTGEVTKLIENVMPRCLHISLSGDEKRIVFDTQRATPMDENLNHLEDVVLFDVATGKTRVLAHQMEGRDHPRQMHPSLNRKGDKVHFTVADGPNSKVAVVRID